MLLDLQELREIFVKSVFSVIKILPEMVVHLHLSARMVPVLTQHEQKG